MHFGENLTIDGYKGNFNKLNDEKLVLKALNELVEGIGMTKMAGPFVYKAPPVGTKDPGGWSGFVVIQESHISIHTFPARGFLSADVYSCKNGFNTELVINYLKDVFELKDIEQNFIKRGTRYPEKDIY
jgi:S-adenosylmethionine decarboxylase